MMLDYYNPDDLDVRVAELLVATVDGADDGVAPQVQEVLRLLREKLGMDVVFVSEFVDGLRRFRMVDRAPDAPPLEPGQADPLEESWCQRVVDGRVPEYVHDAAPLVAAGQAPDTGVPIGTHISAPIRSADGRAWGTLCCFAQQVRGEPRPEDLRRLKYSAQMLAAKLDETRAWPKLDPA